MQAIHISIAAKQFDPVQDVVVNENATGMTKTAYWVSDFVAIEVTDGGIILYVLCPEGA